MCAQIVKIKMKKLPFKLYFLNNRNQFLKKNSGKDSMDTI